MSNNNVPIIRQRKVPSRRRRDGLIRHARDVTSQNGEDGIIERLFQLLPPLHNNRKNRFCVDVGAWDGVHLSNTNSLLVPRDGSSSSCEHWKGVLIEADPERFQALRALHEPLDNKCLGVAVSCLEESPNGLVALLQGTDTPSELDFLCIDVDGSDYWLFHDILVCHCYKPRVICVEFNPTMPHDLIYIPPRTDSARHGASLAALCELAHNHDHVLVETTLYNAFFVPRQHYDQFLKEEVPEPTIEALHEMSMGTSLYQLYDGTLKLSGCRKLLWHRVPLKEKDFQVLPANQRTFPFAPPPSSDTSANHQELHNLAIDMSSYCQAHNFNETKRQECADALWKQLCQDGFALVRGTDISSRICNNALDATRSFLCESDESVRRSCLAKDRARRGYSPMCTENFASLVGTKGPNDMVRKFRIGPPGESARDKSSSPLLRPNLWPTDSVWNEQDATFFRSSIESYYEASCHAARAVVRAICNALVRQEPSLARSMEVLTQQGEAHDSSSILTLLGYSPSSRRKKRPPKPLVAPHTDVGIITFLLYNGGDNSCAVLQRNNNKSNKSDQNNNWMDVLLPSQVPDDDAIFVVNIGDCLSELCGGLLPSTLHRVMPRPGALVPRSCLALFVGLEPDQQLILPSDEKEEETVLTFEEWRRNRIARSQQMLKSCNEQKVQ